MLSLVGAKDRDELMNTAMPVELRREGAMDLGRYTQGMSETEFLEHFKCASSVLRPAHAVQPVAMAMSQLCVLHTSGLRTLLG
jgi:glycine cleavage system pyridoxal-binding protein P